MSEVPDTGAEVPQSAAARLFDLRVLIGGLFLVYGVMLTVAGFFTSARELAKASGININFWMGIGMLIIGIVLRLLVVLLCTEPLHRVDFANAVSLLLILWWSESNISTMLGGLATRGIAQYVILSIALRPRRAQRAAPTPRGIPAISR